MILALTPNELTQLYEGLTTWQKSLIRVMVATEMGDKRDFSGIFTLDVGVLWGIVALGYWWKLLQ